LRVGGKAACNLRPLWQSALKLDLWDEFKMLVKLVDNPEEMNLNRKKIPDVLLPVQELKVTWILVIGSMNL
jgi:hypothetical protein